jgi:hypothetical protein
MEIQRYFSHNHWERQKYYELAKYGRNRVQAKKTNFKDWNGNLNISANYSTPKAHNK